MARLYHLRLGAALETLYYTSLDSWERLLESIDAHVRGHQHNLAVHASTACQPQKALALVPDLFQAGLNEAHVTASGAWSCTLDLPALFAPGDHHPYRRTVEACTKGQVVQAPL